MDLETFAWLLTPAGQRLLARAEELWDLEPDDPLARGRRLRGGATAEQAAAGLTQAGLRRRAQEKLGEAAARMYFTSEGLEQATRRTVADHRARRARAGAETVLDLGCGIGGDLVAFARAGLVVAGLDSDPLRVALARANLAALGLGGAVQVGDVTTVDTGPFDLAFADPARRGPRGRTFHAGEWSPPWSFVEGLLTRDSCLKLAPGLPHDLVPHDVEAEWVSDRGGVKEAVLWSGRLATTRRRATVIGEGGLATLTSEDLPPGPPPTGDVAAYLLEPDGAVIRAGLVGAVAARAGGHLLDPHIAYVAAPQAPPTPYARCYRVLEQLPYREKQLRAALRERGVGALTIKTRGVSVTPEQLRPRLRLRGDAAATVVLTRVAGTGTALLVEPV